MLWKSDVKDAKCPYKTQVLNKINATFLLMSEHFYDPCHAVIVNYGGLMAVAI